MLYDNLRKRRALCLGTLAALCCLLVVLAYSLRYSENIFDFLPVGGDDQKAMSLYQDITGGQSIIAVFKGKTEDVRQDVLEEAVDYFESNLSLSWAGAQVRDFTCRADLQQIEAISDFIYGNIPLMLTDSDYVRMENILGSKDYVERQLEADLQMIMMPGSDMFSAGVQKDPLALFSPVQQRLTDVLGALPVEYDNGYIYTRSGRCALATMTSPYGTMESAKNSALVGELESVAKQTMASSPEVEILITGAPVIAVENARRIKKDSALAISIAVILIFALLVYSFRKAKNLILIAVPVLFGCLFAMGLIALARNEVSVIVLGIGSIIIGIAVNYPLHFVYHTSSGADMHNILREMVPPLLIGNITTVGAFASLIPLDSPALRDLGLIAAFMLIGTIVFVLVFLPHLTGKSSVRENRSLLPEKFYSASLNGKPLIFSVMAALTLVFVWLSLKTQFDTDIQHINYMSEDQKALISGLDVSAGINDSSNIYLVTEGKTWDDALTQRESLAPLLDSLHNSGSIDRYTDITSFVASSKLQKHRLETWNLFWSRHKADVISELESNAQRLGFSKDAFKDFQAILDESYSVRPFEYFAPLTGLLFKNSFREQDGVCSTVDLAQASKEKFDEAEAAVNLALGAKGYSFDFGGMNDAMARSLTDDFNYIGLACSLIVFVFLWLSFGRLEITLLAFLPMAVGWVWILGIMYLLGLKFNIVNIILATFIFGQGDDYTIFITEGLIDEFAYRKKILASYKESILISALIMFIGMGSLIFAKHPALHSLAEVTIVGMLAVVLSAWTVPPLIFGWLVRKNGKTRDLPLTFGSLFRKKPAADAVKDSHYFHNYIIGKYTYKGYAVERETRRLLKKYDDFSRWIDAYPSDSEGRVTVLNAGKGQFSLLFALVHPQVEVYSYTAQPEDAALAKACSPFPENLHVFCSDGSQELSSNPATGEVFDLLQITE